MTNEIDENLKKYVVDVQKIIYKKEKFKSKNRKYSHR